MKKYQDSSDGGKVNTFPNLALLTPLGMPFLIPHLKNSFFPSTEKEQVPDSEVSVSGGGDDKKMDEFIEETDKDFNDDEFIGEFTSTSSGTNAVRYYDEEGNEIDALSPEAENLKKEAKDLFNSSSSSESNSSTISAISNQASYEKSSAGTVILEKPKRNDFDNTRSGANQYSQAMVMYNNQKSMLNSYFKTQVRASLYKI